MDNFAPEFSKEEKEKLLNQKMEAIRKKNEELKKRHEEIEADKKLADKYSASVQINDVKPYVMKPPRPRPEKVHTFSGADSNMEGESQSSSPGQEVLLSRQRLNQSDGPPPDPSYRFLADPDRDSMPEGQNKDQEEGGTDKSRRRGGRGRGRGRGMENRGDSGHAFMHEGTHDGHKYRGRGRAGWTERGRGRGGIMNEGDRSRGEGFQEEGRGSGGWDEGAAGRGRGMAWEDSGRGRGGRWEDGGRDRGGGRGRGVGMEERGRGRHGGWEERPSGRGKWDDSPRGGGRGGGGFEPRGRGRGRGAWGPRSRGGARVGEGPHDSGMEREGGESAQKRFSSSRDFQQEGHDRGRGKGRRGGRRGRGGQRAYEQWKAERDSIDEARLLRARSGDGEWRREWDMEKIDQTEDDSERVYDPRYPPNKGESFKLIDMMPEEFKAQNEPVVADPKERNGNKRAQGQQPSLFAHADAGKDRHSVPRRSVNNWREVNSSEKPAEAPPKNSDYFENRQEKYKKSKVSTGNMNSAYAESSSFEMSALANELNSLALNEDVEIPREDFGISETSLVLDSSTIELDGPCVSKVCGDAPMKNVIDDKAKSSDQTITELETLQDFKSSPMKTEIGQLQDEITEQNVPNSEAKIPSVFEIKDIPKDQKESIISEENIVNVISMPSVDSLTDAIKKNAEMEQNVSEAEAFRKCSSPPQEHKPVAVSEELRDDDVSGKFMSSVSAPTSESEVVCNKPTVSIDEASSTTISEEEKRDISNIKESSILGDSGVETSSEFSAKIPARSVDETSAKTFDIKENSGCSDVSPSIEPSTKSPSGDVKEKMEGMLDFKDNSSCENIDSSNEYDEIPAGYVKDKSEETLDVTKDSSCGDVASSEPTEVQIESVENMSEEKLEVMEDISCGDVVTSSESTEVPVECVEKMSEEKLEVMKDISCGGVVVSSETTEVPVERVENVSEETLDVAEDSSCGDVVASSESTEVPLEHTENGSEEKYDKKENSSCSDVASNEPSAEFPPASAEEKSEESIDVDKSSNVGDVSSKADSTEFPVGSVEEKIEEVFDVKENPNNCDVVASNEISSPPSESLEPLSPSKDLREEGTTTVSTPCSTSKVTVTPAKSTSASKRATSTPIPKVPAARTLKGRVAPATPGIPAKTTTKLTKPLSSSKAATTVRSVATSKTTPPLSIKTRPLTPSKTLPSKSPKSPPEAKIQGKVPVQSSKAEDLKQAKETVTNASPIKGDKSPREAEDSKECISESLTTETSSSTTNTVTEKSLEPSSNSSEAELVSVALKQSGSVRQLDEVPDATQDSQLSAAPSCPDPAKSEDSLP